MADLISPEFIKQQAEKLLLDSGVAGQFPVPLEKVARHLGFTAHNFDSDSQTENVSGAVDHNARKIYVNSKENPLRQFFTVAHEIGHICLHGNENHIDYRGNKYPLSPKEREADEFAACLLMPAAVFYEQWDNLKQNIAALSKFFGVSEAGIAIRAAKVGLSV